MSTPAHSRARTAKASFVGALAGLVSTMLGVGGGVVMVPLFALLGVMRVKRAAGTSLALISVVIAVGLIAQLIRAPEDPHWVAAGLLSVGAFSGTFIGRWIHEKLPEMLFRYAFCAALLAIAAQMLRVIPEVDPLLAAHLDATNLSHVAFLLVAGLFAGMVAVLFGLGGGVVVVPLLALGFGYFNDNFTATRATSLAMILPTSITGAILHLRMRNVDVPLVLKVLPFALVAAVAGVYVAYLVPQQTLKTIFALVLLVAILRLMRRKGAVVEEPQSVAPEVTPADPNFPENSDATRP